MQTAHRSPETAQSSPPKGSKKWRIGLVVAAGLVAGGVLAAMAIGGNGGVTTVAGDGVLTVELRTDFLALPYSDTSGDTTAGFEVEILSEMASRADLAMETSQPLGEFSPAALHHLWLVEKGEVDVAAQGFFPGLYDYLLEHADSDQFRGIDATRAESPALFTDPYFREDFAVAVNVGLHPEIGSLEDLEAGMTVSTYEDSAADLWVVENLVPRGIEVRRITNGNALSPLSAEAFVGNVVAVVHSLPLTQTLAAAMPDVEIVETIDANVGLAFAVDPSNTALHEVLNDALASMIADGTYQAVYDRWFTNPAGSVAP